MWRVLVGSRPRSLCRRSPVVGAVPRQAAKWPRPPRRIWAPWPTERDSHVRSALRNRGAGGNPGGGKRGGDHLAQAVSYVSGNLGGDNKQTLKNAKVTNVHVNGNTATADLQGGTKTADFTKTGGRWFISGGITPGGGSAAASVQHGSSTATTASPAPSTTSTTAGTGTSAGAPSTPLAGSVKALHDLLKLAGYTVTAVHATGTSGVPGVPGSATAPSEGVQATDGVPVEVISFATMQGADETAAGLDKGAAAGRGAVKQVGTDIFFAVGSGSAPGAAADAASAIAEGKAGYPERPDARDEQLPKALSRQFQRNVHEAPPRRPSSRFEHLRSGGSRAASTAAINDRNPGAWRGRTAGQRYERWAAAAGAVLVEGCF